MPQGTEPRVAIGDKVVRALTAADWGCRAQRRIIVNIATSADGYVARPAGNLDWLTERPAQKGFDDLPEFERSTDAEILSRKPFDRSLQMGVRFSESAVHQWPGFPEAVLVTPTFGAN